MLDKALICNMAEYTIDNGSTVRNTAAFFGVAKSTVHHHLTQELPDISPRLWNGVRNVIEINKRERHIRGGNATKLKYKNKVSKLMQ